MILSASLEFEKKYNSEIVERSSDEFEMPQVKNIVNDFCPLRNMSTHKPKRDFPSAMYILVQDHFK